MPGPGIFARRNGLKQDEFLHKPVLDAVDFTKSPAYKFALKRAQRLGITGEQAKSILNPPKPDDTAD